MKKDQAFKLWDALDDCTSLKATISSFENKKGYGNRRTLQRYAQAHEGFKEDLTSDVVAKKTGWRLKYVKKLRSWWKQKYRKKVRDDQKPGEEVSSRKSEEARPRQKLTWKSPPEQRAAERGRMVRLIQALKWDLAAFSPVRLLQIWLARAFRDAQAEHYTNKDIETLHTEARQSDRLRAWPLLRAQNDPTFALLMVIHPTSKIWPALRSWRQQEILYAVAYYRMLYEAESRADDALARFGKELTKGVDWLDGDTSSGFAKRLAIKRLLAILLVCDSLISGIAARPRDSYLTHLIDRLERLRPQLNGGLSMLTGITPTGGWSSGLMDVPPESPNTVPELAAPLLDELDRLRQCETALTGRLTELKSVIEFLD